MRHIHQYKLMESLAGFARQISLGCHVGGIAGFDFSVLQREIHIPDCQSMQSLWLSGDVKHRITPDCLHGIAGHKFASL